MKVRHRAWWVVAVLATGVCFVSYLELRFETVRMGYELDEATTGFLVTGASRASSRKACLTRRSSPE